MIEQTQIIDLSNNVLTKEEIANLPMKTRNTLQHPSGFIMTDKIDILYNLTTNLKVYVIKIDNYIFKLEPYIDTYYNKNYTKIYCAQYKSSSIFKLLKMTDINKEIYHRNKTTDINPIKFKSQL